MKVHFICTGNTNRSRLAEAYLNSKNLKDVEVFSSGIEADMGLSGPITWWASRLIFNFGLTEYMSYSWQKTTENLLNEGDLTIFMEQMHYDFCKENLGFDNKKYKIWGIADLNQLERIEDKEIIDSSEKAFAIIKLKIDELEEKL